MQFSAPTRQITFAMFHLAARGRNRTANQWQVRIKYVNPDS